MLLALDTATRIGGVAVGDAGRVVAEISVGIQGRSDESLLPAIDYVLRAAEIEPRQLTGVVVGAGPGSFTGLRIAAATAKGLVRALGTPLFSTSSLLAAAAPLGAGGRPVCALFDARRDEVFAACYRFSGDRAETLTAPTHARIGELVHSLETDRALGAIYVGDGALKHRPRIEAAGGTVAPAFVSAPRAGALLWLTGVEGGGERVADPASWEPAYLRPWGAT